MANHINFYIGPYLRVTRPYKATIKSTISNYCATCDKEIGTPYCGQCGTKKSVKTFLKEKEINSIYQIVTEYLKVDDAYFDKTFSWFNHDPIDTLIPNYDHEGHHYLDRDDDGEVISLAEISSNSESALNLFERHAKPLTQAMTRANISYETRYGVIIYYQ